MQVIDTKIDGVKVIQPTVFSDTRGFFMETFEKRRFQDMLDIDLDFVQDNYSRSSRGFCADCTIKISSRKASWFVWCGAKFMMLQ